MLEEETNKFPCYTIDTYEGSYPKYDYCVPSSGRRWLDLWKLGFRWKTNFNPLRKSLTHALEYGLGVTGL